MSSKDKGKGKGASNVVEFETTDDKFMKELLAVHPKKAVWQMPKQFANYLEAETFVGAIFNPYYAVLDNQGSVGIVEWKLDKPKYKQVNKDTPAHQIKLYKQSEFKSTLFAGVVVAYEHTGNDGKLSVKQKHIVDVWLSNPHRRDYDGIVFTSGPAGDALNMWCGFPVNPEEGGVGLFKNTIALFREICANEPDPASAARELINLIAWKFQNPTAPVEKALVIRGSKGTGKNTLLEVISWVFGKSYCLSSAQRDHIFGQFNIHLVNKALVVLNEAFWHGSKKEEGILKSLITDDLTIEMKFGATFQTPNTLLVAMTANEEWVVPASSDERRFVVYDVGEKYRNDRAFFAAVRKEMSGSGGRAFLHFMLNMKLGGWHPGGMVDTRGLNQQKIQSAPAHVRWLVALLANEDSALGRSFGEHNTPKLFTRNQKGQNDGTGREWGDGKSRALGTGEEINAAYRLWLKEENLKYGEDMNRQALLRKLTDTLSCRLLDRKQIREQGSRTVRPWVYFISTKQKITAQIGLIYPGIFK